MLFSGRQGIKPEKNIIQADSMDNDLRNGLWNALTIYYWDEMKGVDWLHTNDEIGRLCTSLWLNYLKRPLDTLDDDWDRTYIVLRKYFYECTWYEVYDFIEFVANTYPDISRMKQAVNPRFMAYCNNVLEKELSGYRFVDGKVTPITRKEEIDEIEEALTSPLGSVNKHLETALSLLSDRQSPDYRNSIKESISAVEALCKVITKNPKATLGQALGLVEGKVKLHADLKEAFKKLYGYTSDADGIRHGLMGESSLNFDDAKFMLVSCSAFINYLVSKSTKAGIKL